MSHYVININDVEPAPVELKDGWSGIDIRFVVDESRSGSKEVCFWRVVFKPGAKHFKHRHTNSDEVIYFIRGRGTRKSRSRRATSTSFPGTRPTGSATWSRMRTWRCAGAIPAPGPWKGRATYSKARSPRRT